MEDQDLMVKEIFAYYGRAMYMAQCVEKGIMNLLLTEAFKHGMTKSRYEELLQEKSALTAGQLKREVEELNLFDEKEVDKISEFHELRNFLVHSFWWERVVEFMDSKLQPTLIIELDEYWIKFENLNDILTKKSKEFVDKHNLDIDEMISEMLSEGRTIPFEKFRKLGKNETVVDIFGYEPVKNSSIPIFQLDDETFWTVSEAGLSQFKYEIDREKKFAIQKVEGIFPVNQFNPRPKTRSAWNYELDLKKKGLRLSITRKSANEPFNWVFK